MFKQALYTYIKLLHPRNIKKIEEPIWRMFLIFWIFGPKWDQLQTEGIAAWYTLSMIYPLAVCAYTNLTTKINRPKALFLVPMTKKDRKHYIKCLLCIKIGVPAVIGVVLECLWGIRYGYSIVDILLTAVIYVSFGISEYICLQVTIPPGGKINHGFRTVSGIIKHSLLNIVNQCVVYVVLLGVTPVRESINPMMIFGEVVDPVVGILIMVMLFLDMLIILRQFDSVLEENCEYGVYF